MKGTSDPTATMDNKERLERRAGGGLEVGGVALKGRNILIDTG